MSRIKELWLEKFEEAQVEYGMDNDAASVYANEEVADLYASRIDQAMIQREDELLDIGGTYVG
ncbi:MAG: hypothetical protein PVI03_04005 [Candidatus Thorarchaeota archaeon]|jgi:hypothetical protein